MADFYQESAEARMERLNYQRQMAMTNLQEARLTGDVHSGGEAAQEIADIDAAKANLIKLHNAYLQSQQPVHQEQTDQEYMHKSPERMDYSDSYRIAAKSKHGVDEAAFRAGIAEVQRRKARGE